MSAPVQGTCDETFAKVRDIFERSFETGEVGAGVAVLIDGEPVIELWGGWADEERTRPWERDTIVNVYSVTKGMASVCLSRLIEQGRLDLDAPVSKYWPEFAQNGKQDIPMRLLVGHQAGLPTAPQLPRNLANDWTAMTTALAEASPEWEPGSQQVYHGVTWGYLNGEVLRRIDGRTMGTYLREEVCEPLRADFLLGVGPEHDARCAALVQGQVVTPFDPAPGLSPEERAADNAMWGPNSRNWRAAEIPSANGHASPAVIGRDRELATLEALLTDAHAGRGRTVLVAGEAGLGKSALLRLFAARARATGARVLVGECTEIEARRPFGPFIDALAGAGLEPPEALGRDDPGAQLVEEAERYRVHAGFALRIGDAAAAGPVVVVVEDLHWGDEATYELFPYLARKLRDQPVLLLATYRSDELHRTHPLNHVLAELARGRLAEEIRLKRLTIDELGDVIRLALGLSRPPTAPFRQALYKRTEGNPFFLEEILRALVENGELEYRDGAWRRTKEVSDLAIPVSIRDAVQQRLVRIPEAARRVIQVAAVIGQRFEFDVLREVTALDEERVVDAVRAAIEAQLVTEEPESDRESYRFRHALSREAVVADLLSRERRILHRSVGEVLERRAPDRMEDLAYHFDEARDARAFRYHVLAAEEATRASAFGRVVHHLDRAIELAPDDEPTLGRLYLRLSDTSYASDDPARSLHAAQEAERVFRAAEDPEGQAEALWRESRATRNLGDAGAAAELARRAVALLEPLGPSRALARSLAELARLAMLDLRADEAVGYARRAVAMAKETSALDIEIDALNTLGPALANEEGIGLLRTSLALALEHGMFVDAQRAYNSLYWSLLRTSDEANTAAQVQEESGAHARRFGIRPESWVLRESHVAFDAGEWDRLLELVDQSRNEAIFSAYRSSLEAFVQVARDGPNRSILAAVEEARTRLLVADQWGRAYTGRAGLPYLLAGRDREALERADAGLESAAAVGIGVLGVVGCSAIVAAHRLGDAAALARWTGAILEHGDAPWALRAQRPFARGALARADGRGEEAARLFAEAAAEADRQPPLFFCATLARLARSELLAQAGDLDGAAEEVERAKVFWRKAKATWYLAELDRWARERGIPAEARA